MGIFPTFTVLDAESISCKYVSTSLFWCTPLTSVSHFKASITAITWFLSWSHTLKSFLSQATLYTAAKVIFIKQSVFKSLILWLSGLKLFNSFPSAFKIKFKLHSTLYYQNESNSQCRIYFSIWENICLPYWVPGLLLFTLISIYWETFQLVPISLLINGIGSA